MIVGTPYISDLSKVYADNQQRQLNQLAIQKAQTDAANVAADRVRAAKGREEAANMAPDDAPTYAPAQATPVAPNVAPISPQSSPAAAAPIQATPVSSAPLALPPVPPHAPMQVDSGQSITPAASPIASPVAGIQPANIAASTSPQDHVDHSQPEMSAQAPAPTGDQAAPSPAIVDHDHPLTQAIGEAMTTGKLSRAQSFRELVRNSDPSEVKAILDNMNTFTTDQKSRIKDASDTFATIAYNMLDKKNGLTTESQRRAYLAAHRPELLSHGVTDEEWQNTPLDDASLHGRIGQALGIVELMKQSDEEQKANRPITAADGGVLQRTPDGSYQVIYTPGQKPTTQVVVDPVTGGVKVVQVAGTPGTSYQGTPASAGQVSTGQSLGERNNNGGNLKDGPFARSQPGYVGHDEYGFARFDNNDHGDTAQINLLGQHYGIGRGATVNTVIDKYLGNGPENSSASRANYKATVARALGIDPNTPIPAFALPQLAASMRSFETGNYSRSSSQPAPASPQNGVNVVDLGGGKAPTRIATAAEAAQYGAKHGQINTRTGEFTETGKGDGDKPITQNEGNAGSFADRMTEADNDITAVAKNGLNPANLGTAGVQASLGHLGAIGHYFQSPDYQRFEQAKLNFLNAVLRKESGAAISPGEIETGNRQYFPVAGDNDATLTQKSQNRRIAISGMRQQQGAYKSLVDPTTITQNNAHPTSKVIGNQTYYKVGGKWFDNPQGI